MASCTEDYFSSSRSWGIHSGNNIYTFDRGTLSMCTRPGKLSLNSCLHICNGVIGFYVQAFVVPKLVLAGRLPAQQNATVCSNIVIFMACLCSFYFCPMNILVIHAKLEFLLCLDCFAVAFIWHVLQKSFSANPIKWLWNFKGHVSNMFFQIFGVIGCKGNWLYKVMGQRVAYLCLS